MIVMKSDIKIPEGYEFIDRGDVRMVVCTKYRSCLLEQGIDQPETLLQQAATDGRTGRGAIGSVPIHGKPGERMIIRQYLRGGIIRVFNRAYYMNDRRPFHELAVCAHAASVGLPTASVLAAVSVRSPNGMWKGYLFVKELAGCCDLPTYMFRLWQHDPHHFLVAKRRILDRVASLVRHMHEQGLAHGDLNMKNILINTNNPEQVYIIDWDKSRVLQRSTAAARRANVLRLCRSMVKLGKLGYPFDQHDAVYFLQISAPSPQRFRRDVLRLRFSIRLRNIFWKHAPRC
ncbi:MAG: phosphotransferase [Desulfobacterota bacterium]|nr:phosphotransferase [Thermodesulfobacteriota bacterium]